MKQLPLPFADLENYAAEDFCTAASNALALKWLAKPQDWTNGRLILWGEADTGKTHLLHIWGDAQGAAIYHGPALPSLPLTNRPIAIDDSDTATGETELLYILNAAAEARQPVLLTARTPPARQSIQLPDLASRLRASLAVKINPPDDALLAALLTRLAADRQLTLNFQVRNFLLGQLPRTPSALREAVTRLDHYALAAGSKITRNMAAKLLNDLILQQAGV